MQGSEDQVVVGSRPRSRDSCTGVTTTSALGVRADCRLWCSGMLTNRTAVAAFLMVLGVLAALVFLWRWQGHRNPSAFDGMYAPSKAAPPPKAVDRDTQPGIVSAPIVAP